MDIPTHISTPPLSRKQMDQLEKAAIDPLLIHTHVELFFYLCYFMIFLFVFDAFFFFALYMLLFCFSHCPIYIFSAAIHHETRRS